MKKRKQSFTLLEIMIVIFLIGIIGSVIGYSMKGSLDKGKAFKTERAIEQIKDILMLQIDYDHPLEKVCADPAENLKLSGLVKKPEDLLKDGWGGEIVVSPKTDGSIKAVSQNLINYKNKMKIELNDDERDQ